MFYHEGHMNQFMSYNEGLTIQLILYSIGSTTQLIRAIVDHHSYTLIKRVANSTYSHSG
jgi:hypothetical protein